MRADPWTNGDWPKPFKTVSANRTPDSHVRAMLDYADSTSDAQAADDYAQLQAAFKAGQVRLAAHQIRARVSHAIEAAAVERDPQKRQHAVAARWQEVQAPQQSAGQQSTEERPQEAAQRHPAVDPVSGATTAVEDALARLDKALMDEGATQRRAAVDAEHLQKRLRKVGRILAKVTVPADDVVDAEIVDAEIVRDDEPRG